MDPQVLALWSTDPPEVGIGRVKLLEHDVHAAEHATFHTHGAGPSSLGTERDLLGEAICVASEIGGCGEAFLSEVELLLYGCQLGIVEAEFDAGEGDAEEWFE